MPGGRWLQDREPQKGPPRAAHTPPSGSPTCSPLTPEHGLARRSVRVPSGRVQVQSHARQALGPLQQPGALWPSGSTAGLSPESGDVGGMPAPCPLSTHARWDKGGATGVTSPAGGPWPTATPLRARPSGHQDAPQTLKHLPAPQCAPVSRGEPTRRRLSSDHLAPRTQVPQDLKAPAEGD